MISFIRSIENWLRRCIVDYEADNFADKLQRLSMDPRTDRADFLKLLDGSIPPENIEMRANELTASHERYHKFLRQP
jgi:hypothetical protein